jgi:hypothetical protein
MKRLKVRQRSFQKLTQFTMLNKVQDPLAFTINASLLRAAVFLFHLNGEIQHKGDVADPGNTERYAVLL